jgi:hypothetical protein
VHEVSPDVYGDDAGQAQLADRDYEREIDMSNPYASIANLLKDNSDPAYHARIIERLEAEDLLEIHVEELSLRQHYNGWPEALLEALQGAEERGVISEEQLEQYSVGLE